MEALVVRSCLRTRYLHSYNHSNVIHHHSVRRYFILARHQPHQPHQPPFTISRRWWLARHQPPKPRRRYFKRIREIEKLKNATELPIFDKVFNNFVKLAHPDQLQAFGDEYKSVNATSWAKFTEILKVINVKGSQRQMIPNQAIYSMEFYIRPSQNKVNKIREQLKSDQLDIDIYNSSILANQIKRVKLDLRLSGQRCPDLMKSQLQHFFQRCGIRDYRFEWGPNYWASSRDKLRLSADEKQRKEDTDFVEKEEKPVMEKERTGAFDKLKFWKKKKK